MLGDVLGRAEQGDAERGLRIDITDTGIGISQSVIDRLFTAFTQADGSMSRRYGGTGLGLVIVRKLCRLMHGDITVTSEVGVGSTFSVSIALAPAGVTESRDELGGAEVAGRRALIVEASSPVRIALADQLRGLGMVCDAVATTADASVCIQAARDAGAPHAVVLSVTAIEGMPSWIRLVRENDTRAATAIELPRPVRRWRLIGALRHAFGVSAPPVRSRTVSQNSTNLAGLRILVAEDNLINQEVTMGILADLGCFAVCVGDGAQALEALSRDSFNIVLMDCQMPVMDGYDTTRTLRKRELATGAHQTVIALTANASSEDREACRLAGMDDFLSKPFQRAELSAMLGKHVGMALPVAAAPVEPVAAVPVEPVPTTASVLDPATLAQIRATQRPGRPDLAARILALFLERSPAQLSEIREAAGDPVRLARAAHALKGGSANIGLVQLASLLSSIEQHAKRNELTAIPTLLDALPDTHAAAMRAVRHELAPQEPHV